MYVHAMRKKLRKVQFAYRENGWRDYVDSRGDREEGSRRVGDHRSRMNRLSTSARLNGNAKQWCRRAITAYRSIVTSPRSRPDLPRLRGFRSSFRAPSARRAGGIVGEQVLMIDESTGNLASVKSIFRWTWWTPKIRSIGDRRQRYNSGLSHRCEKAIGQKINSLHSYGLTSNIRIESSLNFDCLFSEVYVIVK